MLEKSNKYLIIALLLGLFFHGGSMAFTLQGTYDALIHLFFADHYASNWFDVWNESWYTGFTVLGYPPLVHQTMALLSFIGGLKFALFAIVIIGTILFITGVYRFSLMLTGSRKTAGYAAIIAVFSSSFVETLHLFGQLPSILGISLLLHALPEIYGWIKTQKLKHLIYAWSLISVTVTSHHVTPIFGMVFFIFPVIGMALMDLAKETSGNYKNVRFGHFWHEFRKRFWTIIVFGCGSLCLIILCILPYWINTKNNPITQVPIPHGSRDNFLEVLSSGLVFFAIPWGILFFFLPYIFYRYYSKRYLFFGLSFGMLTLLGTGGTTPIPKLLLGNNAFNILTLDRFTLWATIMALPIFGEFVERFSEGDIKEFIQQKWGTILHRLSGGFLSLGLIVIAVFTLNLSNFRPSQPKEIDMLPIVNFLNQDQHDRWRYLTLGFGDQMAWLSALTDATSVDGNYHSARRLPELTSRAVERLENSKFRGIEGLGSLQQFLAVPEKYHLKYVFSNDKFYDPVLYFSGWHRLPTLENGISVWERSGIPPLPNNQVQETTPYYLKFMWGIVPLATLIIAFLLHVRSIWIHTFKLEKPKDLTSWFQVKYGGKRQKALLSILGLWILASALVCTIGLYQFQKINDSQNTPENVVKAYFDAMDFKEFEKAHSLFSPKSNKSIADFMLEISVSDGLLNSYGKLDAITTQILAAKDNRATIKAQTVWITPLKSIEREEILETIQLDGKWYILPNPVDLDIPPDQLITASKTIFYNHGRRRITTQNTFHEDILRQPVIEVLDAQLIEEDGKYMVIGHVQNIDRIPADLSISSTLYGVGNSELATFNAKDHMKHKLQPMEITPFRIDFEGIAWSGNEDRIPETFNPDEFTPELLSEKPSHFGIEVTANLATSNINNSVAIQSVRCKGNRLSGQLFNSGVENITVPQVLMTYFDRDLKLLRVERHYLEESIRPQRTLNFSIPLPDTLDILRIGNGSDHIYINGVPNDEIVRKMINGRTDLYFDKLIPIHSDESSFIGVTLNNFIGNTSP